MSKQKTNLEKARIILNNALPTNEIDAIDTEFFESSLQAVEIAAKPDYILLKKYMQHVEECEGSNFLNKINAFKRKVKFTDEEIETLNSF